MNQVKFGTGKIIGFIILFPFFAFLIYSYLYIPVSLYSSSTALLGDNNPWEMIQNDVWNPSTNPGSNQSYGIYNIVLSSLRVSIETTLIVLLPALLFAIIILYLSPSWIRVILEILRDFLYLIPTILLVYIGYFYISPLITGETGELSGLLTSRVLLIFAFPYAVYGFMFGLTRIWQFSNTANPTFGGRILKKDFGIKKIILLVIIILLVALITFAKVFGETLIFNLLSGTSSTINYMNINAASQNISSTIVSGMNNIITITESGKFVVNNGFFLGILLFLTFLLYIFTFLINTISNLGLGFIGVVHHDETNYLKTKFGKVPAIKSFFKIIFSIIGLSIVGIVVYFIIINFPEKMDISILMNKYPDLIPFLDNYQITDLGSSFFSANFIWYALLLGVPIGIFLGAIIRKSRLSHISLGIIRIFDNVPIICVGIFGFVFFVYNSDSGTISTFFAGLTTALVLAPKIAILVYEAINNSMIRYHIIKTEKPYISIGKDFFSSILKIIGSGFQVYGLMFGIVVTIMFTGSQFSMEGFTPYFEAPFMSFSHQLYLLINNYPDIEVIKSVLDCYFIKILYDFLLFFLIGTGIKLFASILIDSFSLNNFHKKSGH